MGRRTYCCVTSCKDGLEREDRERKESKATHGVKRQGEVSDRREQADGRTDGRIDRQGRQTKDETRRREHEDEAMVGCEQLPFFSTYASWARNQGC